MKTHTKLCTLIYILLPLSTQALPKLSDIFPCLKKHTRTTVHIPTPTLAQRYLKFSRTITQSKITKAAIATTVLCVCAKKAWDYVQSWQAQLRNISNQLRTENTRNQELQEHIIHQDQQSATQAEQLAQARQQATLTEESYTMQLQTTQQALESLQAQINSLPLRAAERLNVQEKQLTRLEQQLKQLKNALTHKAQASHPSSEAKGKAPAESSSHLTRARVYPLQPIQSSRINPKIKPDIPHFHNSRHCVTCESKRAQSTSPASH